MDPLVVGVAVAVEPHALRVLLVPFQQSGVRPCAFFTTQSVWRGTACTCTLLQIDQCPSPECQGCSGSGRAT
eukprot:gene11956-biopygen6942